MASFVLRAASMEKKSNSNSNSNSNRSNDHNKGGSQNTKSSKLSKPQKNTKSSSSSSSSKKPPQRGLGVAQLERLRVQERLKKLEEIGQAEASARPNNQPGLHFQFPFSYLEQPKAGASSVGTFTGTVSFSTTPSSEVQPGWFVFRPYGFVNGVGGLVAGVNIVNGGGSGVRTVVVPDRVEVVDRYGMVDHEERSQQGANVLKIIAKEKELTSTQVHCSSDHCYICHKKKRLNEESNSSLGFIPMTKINGSDSLGLCLGRNTTGIDEQAMGVNHKNRNGSGVIMEYEFFPAGSSTNRSTNKEDYSYSSSVGGAEGSSGADSAAAAAVGGGVSGAEASSGIHFIDLSLKLSC